MSEVNPNLTQSPLSHLYEILAYTRPGDHGSERRGRLAAVILLSIEVVMVFVLIGQTIHLFSDPEPTTAKLTRLLAGYGLAAVWLGIYFFNRRGLTEAAGIAMSIILLIVTMVLISNTGSLAPAVTTLILPVITAGMFGPPASAIGIAFLTAFTYLIFNVLNSPTYLGELFAGGETSQTLFVYANTIIVGFVSWMFSRATNRAIEEKQELTVALTTQRETIMARLQTQTRQFQAAITVARNIVGSRNLNNLLDDAVTSIREAFGYSHVQVFLTDEDQTYAVLRQSTGSTGQQLIERGHRHLVGSSNVIGHAAATGQAIVARDTDQDTLRRHNELIPETRAELALPLSIEERTIGVLDLQSVSADAFNESSLPILQVLADQLAIAIENARLFEEAEENLQELRDISRETAQRSWQEFLADVSEDEVHQTYGPEPEGLRIQRSRIAEKVLSSGSAIISNGEDGKPVYLAVPVVVRNEVIGVLGIEPDRGRDWTQEDLQLMQSIAERTSLAVENARLYIQTQRTAERERIIGTIAERLQRAPSLAMLLETATRELSEALGTDNVYAELSMDHPLARRRKSVSEANPELEERLSEADRDSSTPGETEEARAEL